MTALLCQLSRAASVTLGYVIFFVYVAIIMVVGELVQKKTKLDAEVIRKLEHIATGASWAIAYAFIGLSYHLIIINGISVVLLAVTTFGNLMKSVERTDANKSYGLLYFGISTLAVIVVAVIIGSEKLYLLSGVVYYGMIFGDGLAPLVARLFHKCNVTVFEPKTAVGVVTVAVMGTLSAVVFNAIFKLELSVPFMISVGCLAAMTELYGMKGLDNITIEVGGFLYMLMYFYGLVNTAMMVVLIVSPWLTIVAGASKSLTLGGSITSFIYTLACAFCGGLPVVITIYTLFCVSAVISKITTKKFNLMQGVEKAKTPRGATQIVANSAIALMLLIFYKVFNHKAFLIANYVVLCEEFADSVCSDIGRLSKRKPVDILRFKRIQPGISGGISLLGSICGLLGCVLALLVPFLFKEVDLVQAAIAVGLGFLGTVVDSVLGSAFQVLYQCEVCGNYTEKEICCDTQAKQVKGASFVTNSLVNLTAGMITGLVALALFLFVIIK